MTTAEREKERERQGSWRSADVGGAPFFSVKLSVGVYQSVRVCVRASVSGFFSGRLIFPFNGYRHCLCLLPTMTTATTLSPLGFNVTPSQQQRQTTNHQPRPFLILSRLVHSRCYAQWKKRKQSKRLRPLSRANLLDNSTWACNKRWAVIFFLPPDCVLERL